jgi:hypothetical protein
VARLEGAAPETSSQTVTIAFMPRVNLFLCSADYPSVIVAAERMEA